MGVSFNGTTDYITSTVIGFSNADAAFSMGGWLKATSNPVPGTPGVIGYLRTDDQVTTREPILYRSSAGTYVGGLRNGTEGTSGAVAVDVWAHVFVTYAGTLGNIKMYLNGVLVDTDVAAAAGAGTTLQFQMGGWNTTGSAPSSAFWNGIVANFNYFPRELSLGEVNHLYQQYVLNGSKLLLPLWGTTSAIDFSGTAQTVTLSGALAAAHAPIGRYVPYRVKMPHGGVLFSSLYVESHDPTKARLKWTDNSAGAKAPTVYRSTDDITFTAIATLGAGVVTYENTGLTAATRYYYRVGYD